jgi:hypothetical protein
MTTPSGCTTAHPRIMDLRKNADDSVDIYCGPKAPADFEKNWIPTVPGKHWFAYCRFYEPTEAYFDRSWPLPDFEQVDDAMPETFRGAAGGETLRVVKEVAAKPRAYGPGHSLPAVAGSDICRSLVARRSASPCASYGADGGSAI